MDLSTLRRLSWSEKTALVLCDVQHDAEPLLVEEALRSLLRKQRSRLESLGFEGMAGIPVSQYTVHRSWG